MLLSLYPLPDAKSMCSDDVHESVESTQFHVLLPSPDVAVIPLPSHAASFAAPDPRTIFLSSKRLFLISRLFKDVEVTKGFAVHNKKGIGKNKKHSCKIYIVDNLHELDFRSTLAHEYLHTWMMINDVHSHYWKFNDMSMTEGFAQLGNYLVFTDEGSLLGKKKIEFHLDLYDDNDYGEGYRKMKVCLDYYGWDRLIDKVLNKKDLSCFDDKNLLYLNMNKINN